MLLSREKEHRKYKTITDKTKKLRLIEKYFLNRPYFIKGSHDFIQGFQITSEGMVIVDTRHKLGYEVTMYNIFKKYVEFCAKVVQNLSPERYLLDIHTINIASEERKYNRVSVDMNTVCVSNFRATRNSINASLFNIPTSVKVHFKQYQHTLKNEADEVIVDVFDKSVEKQDMVRRSGKVLYIEDTRKPESFEPEDSDRFINVARNSDLEVPQLMQEYRNHKIVSEMIVPISYTGHDGIPIPLGYIQLISRTNPIAKEKADTLMKVGSEIVQKMRDSNTVLINERQKIENISMEGMSVRITNAELIKLMPEQNGITFDVIFKLTQPLTVSAEIMYFGMDDDDLIVGFKIAGFSTKSSDANRYYSMVKLLT